MEQQCLKVIEAELNKVGTTCSSFTGFAEFPQFWGSTALGFDGIGGQAITTAYTTIAQSVDLDYVAVLFDERLAYIIHNPNDKFYEDVRGEQMLPVSTASVYGEVVYDETSSASKG